MEIGFWASLAATYITIIVVFVLLMRTAHNTTQTLKDESCTTTPQAESPVKTGHSPTGQTQTIFREGTINGNRAAWTEFYPPIEFDAKDSRDLLSDS